MAIWNDSVNNMLGDREISKIYCGNEVIWSRYRIGEKTGPLPLTFRADGRDLIDWRITGAAGGVGVVGTNKLRQEEKDLPNGYNSGVIEYRYSNNSAAIPGGSDYKMTDQYNQFIYAYPDYDANDKALDARTQSYNNAQFFATLAAGSYKLVLEYANGTEDAITWSNSILNEPPFMALLDENNNVIVSDDTFNQITGRIQWVQRVYDFTLSEAANVGLFYKLYPNNFRAYIVPANTTFEEFTNSDYTVTGHPAFSGETAWEPYEITIPVRIAVEGGNAQTIHIPVDDFLGAGDTITFTDTGVAIPTYSGVNIIDIPTTPKPSEMYIKYYY